MYHAVDVEVEFTVEVVLDFDERRLSYVAFRLSN